MKNHIGKKKEEGERTTAFKQWRYGQDAWNKGDIEGSKAITGAYEAGVNA